MATMHRLNRPHFGGLGGGMGPTAGFGGRSRPFGGPMDRFGGGSGGMGMPPFGMGMSPYDAMGYRGGRGGNRMGGRGWSYIFAVNFNVCV